MVSSSNFCVYGLRKGQTLAWLEDRFCRLAILAAPPVIMDGVALFTKSDIPSQSSENVEKEPRVPTWHSYIYTYF